MHLTSCGTLVIHIISTGEFRIYFTVIFFYFHFTVKKKRCCRIVFFLCCLLCHIYIRIACPVGLNYDQMEHLEGEQYSQYPVERNHGAYMSMRDYRNPQWMSEPFYNAPPTYAPPTYPSRASIPQPPQPPQLISSVEKAILNLTKLVGDVVEEQKKFNAQLSQKKFILWRTL